MAAAPSRSLHHPPLLLSLPAPSTTTGDKAPLIHRNNAATAGSRPLQSPQAQGSAPCTATSGAHAASTQPSSHHYNPPPHRCLHCVEGRWDTYEVQLASRMPDIPWYKGMAGSLEQQHGTQLHSQGQHQHCQQCREHGLPPTCGVAIGVRGGVSHAATNEPCATLLCNPHAAPCLGMCTTQHGAWQCGTPGPSIVHAAVCRGPHQAAPSCWLAPQRKGRLHHRPCHVRAATTPHAHTASVSPACLLPGTAQHPLLQHPPPSCIPGAGAVVIHSLPSYSRSC
jgi:hypothetical protein